MRVLIAEDERMLADTIATGLRREAMAVDVVYDGEAALERLDLNAYDVLVLDRDLPVRHGDEVCRELARRGADVRVLMLTAAVDVPDRVSRSLSVFWRCFCSACLSRSNSWAGVTVSPSTVRRKVWPSGSPSLDSAVGLGTWICAPMPGRRSRLACMSR